MISRVVHIAFLILFWLIFPPVALVLALLMSLEEVFRAMLNLVTLTFDLLWFTGMLICHIANTILHLLTLISPEKLFRTHSGVKHVGAEVVADLRRFSHLPRVVLANFFEVIRRIRPFLRRARRSIESLPIDDRTVLHHWHRRRRAYGFEKEYAIVERLPSGGSTAQLFVVRRRERGGNSGKNPGEKLVIKYFNLTQGSHLENVIRESGAVQLATRLGIVRDSRMTKTSFYYVMPYYKGRTLTQEVLGSGGYGEPRSPTQEEFERFLGWIRDLLEIIAQYHERGVFHKDIKPDNLIVEGDRLHLVDIGLLTPLESTLQLTTHGTEYFRDPEMVKLAVRGVSIRDVDCAKFDVYSIGAVLYFMIEGAFPSSGSLSAYSGDMPLCLQWICNKAMTAFTKRYASARQMLQDVEDLLALGQKKPLGKVRVSGLSSFGDPSGGQGEHGEPVRQTPPWNVVSPRETPDDTAGVVHRPGASDEPRRPERRGVWRFARLGGLFGLLLLCGSGAMVGAFYHRDPGDLLPRSWRFPAEARSIRPESLPDPDSRSGGFARPSSTVRRDAPPWNSGPDEAVERGEAVEAIVAAVDHFRSRAHAELRRRGGANISSLGASVLIVPLGENAAGVDALERDLKLGLARRGIPFETDVDESSLRSLAARFVRMGFPPSRRWIDGTVAQQLSPGSDTPFLLIFRLSEEPGFVKEERVRKEGVKQTTVQRLELTLHHPEVFHSWSLRYRA